MSEPRRIEVTSTVSVNLEKNKNKMLPTIRLVVPLTESTDDTHPEFSYVELCKNTEEKQGVPLDPDDPFAAQDQAEHDKMVAVAKGFETKYGTQPGKRKHTGFIEDFIDLGEGYEEDSFVDNSEAYDELVPSTMRTKYGGFYINTGELDFVAVDDPSLDGQPIKKKIKKQRVIESEMEENGSSDKKRKVHKMKENGNEEPVKKKRKKINLDEGKRCKGPPGRVLKSDKCRTVAEFLNEANNTPTPTVIKPPPEPSQNPALSPIRKTLVPGTEKLVVSSPTLISRSLSMSADQRDRLVEKDAVVETKVESNVLKADQNVSKIESSIDAVILQSREDAEADSLKDGMSEIPQNLLSSLSSELCRSVERMKELALAGKVTSEESSSGQRFTNEAQQLLVEIHESIAKLSHSDRAAVFNYLGCYFPSGKEGLIKRMKKLDLTLHGDQLKQPIAKLKEAIQAVMPSLIEKHRVEVSAKEKLRLDQLQEQKERKEPKDGTTQSDSDDEEDNRDTAEKQRRIVAPRKKFEWNNEIRKQLCKVVDVKMEYFEMSKIRSQTPEDYLKSFLEAEIKPLWPPGWIQTRMLFKESRSSHFRWTCNTQKPKKSAVVTPKTSTPIVGTPLDHPELGINHQSGNFVSFGTPVSLPSTKTKPSLEESHSANVDKLQELPQVSDMPGSTVANDARTEPSAEVLFTSISSKTGNVSERDLARSGGWDSMLESEISVQKLKKSLMPKSPAIIPEVEIQMQRSATSKASRADGSMAVPHSAETTDAKVINISSSTGSETSSLVTGKSQVDSGMTSVIDNDAVEKLASNCSLKSTALTAVVTPMSSQAYHEEFLRFSSKKSSPGTDEDQPTDTARCSDLPEQVCVADDNAEPISSVASGTSFSEPVVRSASGKVSDVTLIPPVLACKDDEVTFTEVRSFCRQSNLEANNNPLQMTSNPTRKLDPAIVDLQSAATPAGSHLVPDVSSLVMRQDAKSGSLQLSQFGLPRMVPPVRNLCLPKAMPQASQVSPVSPTSNSAQKWVLKPASNTAWASPSTGDEKVKGVADFSKLVSNNRSTSGSVLSTLSSSGSGGYDSQYTTKDSSSRGGTYRSPVQSDNKTVARAATSRSNIQVEEAAKAVPKLPRARQTVNAKEDIKALMRSVQLSDTGINQVISALLASEFQKQKILGSCQATQGSNKTVGTDTRPPFAAGCSKELARHFCPDQSRLYQGKPAVSTTTAQALWRHTSQTQASSATFGACGYDSGYKVGQQLGSSFSDRSMDYGQLQSIKTSLPSSVHDLHQKSDGVKQSTSQAQNTSPSVMGHPQQGFYGNSGGQRNASSSQGQNSATFSMPYKTDSQSSQHQHQ